MTKNEEIKHKINTLVNRGQEILDAEEENCIYGGRTICSMSTEHLNSLYQSWRKEFDKLINELSENGVQNLPKSSAQSEQIIILSARENGYYKIKQYWMQHIGELRNIQPK